MILRIQHANPAIDRFTPGSAARRGGAAIVYAHDDVALLRQHRMPHATAAPGVERRLPPGLAVDVKEHRVAFLRIEAGRLDHPAVKLHAFAYVDAEELRRTWFELAETFLQFVIVDQRPHTGVLRQADDLYGRNPRERRIDVNRQVATRRENVMMTTRLACRR